VLEGRGAVPGEVAPVLASLGGGSIGAAMAFESEAHSRMREGLIDLLERLETLGPVARMEAAEALEQSEDPALLLTTLRSLLRDLLALRAGAKAELLVNVDLAGRLLPLAQGRLGERATTLAEEAGAARLALRFFANKLLTFDLLVDSLAGE
jgi:hypothetical protein